MVRLGILCSGQGHQHTNMFRFAPEAVPSQDSMKSLFENQSAQMLVVASAYANWLALKPHLPDPIAFLGYSVGELAAFSCAGAINPNTVLPLAQKRGILMNKAKSKGDLGLIGVTGTYLAAIKMCCQQAGVYIAIIINRTSYIIGGFNADLKEAQIFLETAGARVQVLPIDIASHTPLMAEAANGFREILDETPFNDFFSPVISSLTGEIITEAFQAKQTLAQQIDHTIDFDHAMNILDELAPTCVLELGPGKAVSKMYQKHNPKVPCRSVEDFQTLQGIVDWVNKRGA